MTLDHLVSYTFIVIDAAMTIADAKRTIEHASGSDRATHVVISRQAGGDAYWYLFPVDDVRGAIRVNGPAAIVEDVFGLHQWAPTPTAAPSADPADIGETAVIVDGHRVVGFVDRYHLATSGAGEAAEPPAAPPPSGQDRPVRRG